MLGAGNKVLKHLHKPGPMWSSPDLWRQKKFRGRLWNLWDSSLGTLEAYARACKQDTPYTHSHIDLLAQEVHFFIWNLFSWSKEWIWSLRLSMNWFKALNERRPPENRENPPLTHNPILKTTHNPERIFLVGITPRTAWLFFGSLQG